MQINDRNNKLTTYPADNFEAYVPTPMSSSQQYIVSEFSNIIPPNNPPSFVNDNTIPVAHVQQTGIFQFNLIILI